MRTEPPTLGGAAAFLSLLMDNLLGYVLSMGLTKKYLRVGQSTSNRLFGVSPIRRGPSLKEDRTPLQMLVSEQGNISHGRLAVVVLGVLALVVGILMSTLPWVDWIILKQLRLWNGTLSYYYWRQPGVVRLTKVFVFNVTNVDGFLNHGQKPKLEEIGPFVYREEMEKVNVQFHENGTVSFQHNKILRFVPEMSERRDVKLVVPNIPLLTLTSYSAHLHQIILRGISVVLKSYYKKKEFIEITADELLFGYEEQLTNIAHTFYPRGKRPPAKMGLLIGRNTSVMNDVETIYTGHTDMKDFGLITKLNGLDQLPYWDSPPCNSIRASEGSLFPPRDVTKEDIVTIYDKDLCRIWPFRYRHDTEKDGITVGHYTLDENTFTSGDKYPDNKCFCPGNNECPPDGMQNISPCQFGAPIYLSLPHYYGINNPEITDVVEGLKPNQEKHEPVIKLQQKLGVPLQVLIRAQLNIKVTHANLASVEKFPSMYFPIMWIEEGAEHIPDYIVRWIYLSTKVSPWLAPLGSYTTTAFGALLLIMVFCRAYRKVVFTKENIERGKRRILRRGSSFFINGQHRLLIIRDSYSLLQNQPVIAETSLDPDQDSS